MIIRAVCIFIYDLLNLIYLLSFVDRSSEDLRLSNLEQMNQKNIVNRTFAGMSA